MHGKPTLCVAAVCTNKTSLKTGVTQSQHPKEAAMETVSGNVWLQLLTSPNCYLPQASPAEKIVGQHLLHEALLAKAG